MYRVLITEKIHDCGIDILNLHPDLKVDIRLKLTYEELLNCISVYTVLVVRSETKLDAHLIKQSKRLKIIARAGIGLDNIDLKAAEKSRVKVINNLTASVVSVAEHTLAMMLALARKIPEANSSVKSGYWKKHEFTGVELKDKVLGIVGFGKIGKEVALRAQAFGMHLVIYDPLYENNGTHLTFLKWKELLEISDFITFHVPKTKDTINLFSFDDLPFCKRGVNIINLSRGGILNENALLQGIDEGIIAGAALDVFDNEPEINKELFSYPQIILTPHIGGNTEEAQKTMAVELINDIIYQLFMPKEFQNLGL